MLVYLQIIETEVQQSKFEEIYVAYRGLLYYIAFNKLKNEHDAQDAVHNVFVKVAENIEKIQPVSPRTKQLVVTILENQIIDLFRKRSRHPEAEYIEELFTPLPGPEDNDDLLAQCILRLPVQQRQVIWLKYYHGYNLREISKLMDISLPWAQKLDQRAKKKLEQLYQQEGGIL